MKIGLITVIILSFLGIATMSSLVMDHGNMHFGDCLTVAVNGVDCPMGISPIAYLDFHLNLLKIFSTAVFGANILFAFVFLVSLILLVGYIFIGDIFKPQFVYSRFNKFREHLVSRFELNIGRWLTLLENSPATS